MCQRSLRLIVALLCFVFAIRLYAQDANSLVDRGNAWEDKGDHDKAIAYYNEAIRLAPNYWRAYNERGNAWASKSEFDKAIADYNQAVKLQPKEAVLIAIGAIACVRRETMKTPWRITTTRFG